MVAAELSVFEVVVNAVWIGCAVLSWRLCRLAARREKRAIEHEQAGREAWDAAVAKSQETLRAVQDQTAQIQEWTVGE